MNVVVRSLLCLAFSLPVVARAEGGREFLTSCTYGATAGALVGVASLAFVKRPGDNLNNVARGASLGLYAGILLGAYVTWIVPRLGRGDDDVARLQVTPILAAGSRGLTLDGAQADWRVLEF